MTSGPALEATRCVAIVAGDSHYAQLNALLESLARHGDVEDALKLIFTVGDATRCKALATRYGARVVPVQAERATSPALKALLYLLPRVVSAGQYLCLDVDLLIAGALSPLFDLHASLSPGRVLIAPESLPSPSLNLGQALRSIYGSTPAELSRLMRNSHDLMSYPFVVNDGIFVADRMALEAIDHCLRSWPEVVAWVHARKRIRWRQKAALNLVLARSGAAVALDASYNVQLHRDAVTADFSGGTPIARWQGGIAQVLHFNGNGRRLHQEWCSRLLQPDCETSLLTSKWREGRGTSQA